MYSLADRFRPSFVHLQVALKRLFYMHNDKILHVNEPFQADPNKHEINPHDFQNF